MKKISTFYQNVQVKLRN